MKATQFLREAGSALSDVHRRVTQQAMEATGMTEKSEEDDPEVRAHQRLDAMLKRMNKHTDAYLRAMSSMCQASRELAEDFAAAENLPGLESAVPQARAA